MRSDPSEVNVANKSTAAQLKRTRKDYMQMQFRDLRIASAEELESAGARRGQQGSNRLTRLTVENWKTSSFCPRLKVYRAEYPVLRNFTHYEATGKLPERLGLALLPKTRTFMGI